MELLELFEKNYEQIRVDGFESKYLPFSSLKNYVNEKYPDREIIGKSFLGNEIFQLKAGNGNRKVLVWSQMHGNESTGTRAMLDVFEFLKTNHPGCQSILNAITLYFIPMLNPDGATLYLRRNACGIDINRDFNRESSPEIKVLKHTVNQIQPDFLFNLHDQRTIFNVAHKRESATLAFLSPSYDVGRAVNGVREKSMEIIEYIIDGLSELIPGKISKFSDEFYPHSTGDNFTQMGIPTVLVEAGHFPNDYQRDHTRRFNALSILLGLEKISNPNLETKTNYAEIPENNKLFLDIILRNVLVKSNESELILDIGIYFEERLNAKEHEIEFCSKIEEIGDLSGFFGHLEFDVKGKVFVGKSSVFPKIGDLADFSVGNISFDKGKFVS